MHRFGLMKRRQAKHWRRAPARHKGEELLQPTRSGVAFSRPSNNEAFRSDRGGTGGIQSVHNRPQRVETRPPNRQNIGGNKSRDGKLAKRGSKDANLQITILRVWFEPNRKVEQIVFERLLHDKIQMPFAQLHETALEFRVNTERAGNRNEFHIFQQKPVDRILAAHPSPARRCRSLAKKRSQSSRGGGILFKGRTNDLGGLREKVNSEHQAHENRPEKEIQEEAHDIPTGIRSPPRDLFFDRSGSRQRRGRCANRCLTDTSWRTRHGLRQPLPTFQTEDARVVVLCVAGSANFHVLGVDVGAGAAAGAAGFDSVLAAPLPLSCLAACL